MITIPTTYDTTSRHWSRFPVPEAGAGMEFFIFSGIAIFKELRELKGTGSAWDGGKAFLSADYTNVISGENAILPKHWTVDVHLASIFNANVANNTGWSVNDFRLPRYDNRLGGPSVLVASGRLVVETDIAIRDIDAYILRLSYHVTILGKLTKYEGPAIE